MRRIAALTALALVAGVAATSTPALPAVAQSRSACSDGAGNARDQIAGTILDDLLPDFVSNPYSPESPDEVWSRCIDPYLGGPLPAGYNPGGEGPGSHSGEPRILTQDGATFEFQAAGDFVALRSPDNAVELQVRYRRSNAVSFFVGVAVRRGDTTLSIAGLVRDGDPVVTLDGETVDLGDLGWYDLDDGFIVRTGARFFVQFDDGLTFEASRHGFSLLTPSEWAGQFEGLQGNGDGDPTNDLATADGVGIDPGDPDALYGAFLDSWYVDPADLLFPVPFDEVADGPVRPSEVVTLADLDPAAVAAAEETCTANGLVAGAGLEGCLFDVAYTGDASWAVDVPIAAEVRGLPAVGFDPAIEQRVDLDADGAVGPDSPVPGAGRIETRFAADEYTVPRGDAERFLRPSEPCRDLGGAVALVVVGGSPVESLPLVCGLVQLLPQGAFVLRVIAPYGGSPSYGFTIGPAERIDLGALELGREYGGALQQGETAVGALPTAPGATVFVDRRGISECSVTFTVVDSLGEVQGRPRAGCLSGIPLELTGAAPFSLEITASADSQYGFVVTEVADATVTAAAPGEEITLVVTDPGQVASATITLAAGQRVYIETVEDIAGDLTVTGPDGAELASAFSFHDLGLIVAPTSGEYTITIDPEQATVGTQRLIVHDVADDTAVAVRPGDTVRLVVSTPGQRASATIELQPGERIYVETLTDIGGDLVVRGPDGGELRSAFSFADLGLVQAAAVGEYVITIEPADATTGVQTILVHAVDADTEVAARPGAEVTLSIRTPGQRASALIDLDAGDAITIEVVESIRGRLRVLDPSGTEIASGFSFQDLDRLAVPVSGTYTITVEGADGEVGTEVLVVRVVD